MPSRAFFCFGVGIRWGGLDNVCYNPFYGMGRVYNHPAFYIKHFNK